MNAGLRNYALVTGAYWGQTLSDGALRMLVLLHFHRLGYSPLAIASLFLFYEFFGIVTNLGGGWLGARLGLKSTLFAGLAIQIVALGLLALLNPSWPIALSVGYVMAAQALSGIAKDLTKMSSKSAIKAIVPAGDAQGEHSLYKWVAILTGSKNALKGVGFFLGAALLGWLGFAPALWAMAAALAVILFGCVWSLPSELGRMKEKVPFRGMFSMSRPVNVLSAARFFLFGARDVWFVVGLPVFLYDRLGWSFYEVGGFLAAWVIGYGIVQGVTPLLTRRGGHLPGGGAAVFWTLLLAGLSALMAAALWYGLNPTVVVVGGLLVFGVIFAVNSAVHSYLILSYSEGEKVVLNVGFYYMANAGGRLAGTVLSGALFQAAGLGGCLWAAAAFALAAGLISLLLPKGNSAPATAIGGQAIKVEA